MNLCEQIIDTLQQWQEEMTNLQHNAPQNTLSLVEHEEGALLLGKRIAQLALAYQLRALGTGYKNASRPCCCGKRQRFQRHSARSIQTLAGVVQYQRAYYRCRLCQASSFPLDEALQQGQREISAGVERILGLLSAHSSFPQVEKLLAELSVVSLSGRQIETIAEDIGKQAQVQLQEEKEAAWRDAGVEPESAQITKGKTFIVEMDGVQVGLQDGTWQEVKCGVIYEVSQRAQTQEGRWELLKKQVCAYRGEVGEFRQQLWALSCRVGIRECDEVVILGDGASWIDQTKEWLFPKARRILDYYHASQRVWLVAEGRWGEGSVKGKNWAQKQVKKLKMGEAKEVIKSLKGLRIKEFGAEKVRQEAVKYLSARVEQMRYGEYEESGLPIGSGAIESSCKQIVTSRCKQAGMRWSESGVDAILALRCFVLNNRYEELRAKPKIEIEWLKVA